MSGFWRNLAKGGLRKFSQTAMRSSAIRLTMAATGAGVTAYAFADKFSGFSAEVRDAFMSRMVAYADSKEIIASILDNDYLPFRTAARSTDDQTRTVKRVVGDSFKEIVLDPSKDVVVKFYSPNCDTCAAFGVILDTIAECAKELGIDHIVFAEMDTAANYVPGVLRANEEENFPTLKLFKAGNAKLREMREAEVLVDMIGKHNRDVLSAATTDASANTNITTPPSHLSKANAPGVGAPVQLDISLEDYSWSLIIDALYENSSKPFDRDALKAKVDSKAKDIVEKILELSKDQMKIREALAKQPCADYATMMQRVLILKSVGAASTDDLQECMIELTQCIRDKKNEELHFWGEAFMSYDLVMDFLLGEGGQGGANEQRESGQQKA